MNDDIKLPPLPLALNSPLIAGHAQDYVRAVVKADRQRRGDPVASMLVDHANALHPYRAIPMVNVELPNGDPGLHHKGTK